MTDQQTLLVDAVTAWNAAIGNALAAEFKTRKTEDNSELVTTLTLALQSLDRNPAATRANLQTALDLVR